MLSGLSGDPQFREFLEDVLEFHRHLRSLGYVAKVIGIVRFARAVLEHRRSRVSTRRDLHSENLHPGRFDVGAEFRLSRIDISLHIGPTILGVFAVSQKDDDVNVSVPRIFRRCRKGSASRMCVPCPCNANRLVGGVAGTRP